MGVAAGLVCIGWGGGAASAAHSCSNHTQITPKPHPIQPLPIQPYPIQPQPQPDAMHGTVCFRSRKLNDAVGWVAISLYAWFDVSGPWCGAVWASVPLCLGFCVLFRLAGCSFALLITNNDTVFSPHPTPTTAPIKPPSRPTQYGMLHRKHWEHHGATGQPHQDPDFHRGNMALLPWFARFMWEYSTPLQFAKIFAWTMLLQVGRGGMGWVVAVCLRSVVPCW